MAISCASRDSGLWAVEKRGTVSREVVSLRDRFKYGVGGVDASDGLDWLVWALRRRESSRGKRRLRIVPCRVMSLSELALPFLQGTAALEGEEDSVTFVAAPKTVPASERTATRLRS